MRHAMKFVTDPATGKVYPIPAGGAEGEPPADPKPDADPDPDLDADPPDLDDSDPNDDEPLGPAGEKALREMKKRARDAEKELRRIKAEAAKAKPDDKPDDEPDPDKIRQEIESEVNKKYARDRALDKLEARAARQFQNPDLARKLLADQADDFLDEKGNPDVEAINEALTELLEDEPYLAVQDDRRFKGDADGGSRNGSKPSQLTKADLAGMSPEQIVQADAEGRLDRLRGRT